MHIRLGFVSNSSSSSFTCDVCGRTEAGFDMCLDEAEMYECVAGHLFCTDHMPEMSSEDIVWLNKHVGNVGNSDIPSRLCPVCTFKVGVPKELLAYVLKGSGVTERALLTHLEERFADYASFKDYVS